MSIGISCVVLLAAVLHASWNALLRAGVDRLWTMTVMCIAIACAGLALVVPIPARAAWGYAILSALLHVGYNLCLVRTYRTGDLGQSYPIARGSSPLLVSLGAALFAGEVPIASAWPAYFSCPPASSRLPSRTAGSASTVSPMP